jgi:DNA-binding SARP family transcriptional activator
MPPHDDAPIAIRLLGGFAITRGDVTLIDASHPRRKPLALVKLLALQPGRTMTRERVLAALWPELSASAASTQLRKSRLYLRQALNHDGDADELVRLDGGVLALDAGIEIDVDAFRAFERGGASPADAPARRVGASRPRPRTI